MNPSVAHVGIAVTSIDEALGFYRDVLGLVPGGPESADGATIVSLHLGPVAVELLEPREPRGEVSCQPRTRHSSHLLPRAGPRRHTRALSGRGLPPHR